MKSKEDLEGAIHNLRIDLAELKSKVSRGEWDEALASDIAGVAKMLHKEIERREDEACR